jgi:hypothetical protein
MPLLVVFTSSSSCHNHCHNHCNYDRNYLSCHHLHYPHPHPHPHLPPCPGCGSGPLTGRYLPPFGNGFLYWLTPGTTKLPLVFIEKLPLIGSILGGTKRNWIDVSLYFTLLYQLLQALIAPVLTSRSFHWIVLLVPCIGCLDQTIFLALRSEHYWSTIVCFALSSSEVFITQETDQVSSNAAINSSGSISSNVSSSTSHGNGNVNVNVNASQMDWISGAKAVQLALWFWAGVSKLNHHFPTAVAVMTSNSPFTDNQWFRKQMYAKYPDDLRPSTFAVIMAHLGTSLEFIVPCILFVAPAHSMWVDVGMLAAYSLHLFIMSNMPMGVPGEWNIAVVYGAIYLFQHNSDVRVMDVCNNHPLSCFLVIALILVPICGNMVPSAVSFLLSMRYYAGNWPYSVWLFKDKFNEKGFIDNNENDDDGDGDGVGDDDSSDIQNGNENGNSSKTNTNTNTKTKTSVNVNANPNPNPNPNPNANVHGQLNGNGKNRDGKKTGGLRKLDNLVKYSPWISSQLTPLYSRTTITGMLSKLVAFRCMHLQGRVLPTLLNKACDQHASQYVYMEGEVVAGMVLGYNFGDGHLHQERLLQRVQQQCSFEAGELRVITVESQPFLGSNMQWSIFDAKEGLLEAGTVDIDTMLNTLPGDMCRVHVNSAKIYKKSI